MRLKEDDFYSVVSQAAHYYCGLYLGAFQLIFTQLEVALDLTPLQPAPHEEHVFLIKSETNWPPDSS